MDTMDFPGKIESRRSSGDSDHRLFIDLDCDTENLYKTDSNKDSVNMENCALNCNNQSDDDYSCEEDEMTVNFYVKSDTKDTRKKRILTPNIESHSESDTDVEPFYSKKLRSEEKVESALLKEGICLNKDEVTLYLVKKRNDQSNTNAKENKSTEVKVKVTKSKTITKEDFKKQQIKTNTEAVKKIEIEEKNIESGDDQEKQIAEKDINSHAVLAASDKIILLECEHCPFKTDNKISYAGHKQHHENGSRQGEHKCKLCTFSAKNKNSLTTHKRVHNTTQAIKPVAEISENNIKNNLIFQCPVCSKQVHGSSHSLYVHVRRHGGIIVDNFPCHLCSFVASTVAILGKHMKQEHFSLQPRREQQPQIQHFCPLCAYTGTLLSVTCHFRIHGVKHKELSNVLECPICSHKVNTKSFNKHSKHHISGGIRPGNTKATVVQNQSTNDPNDGQQNEIVLKDLEGDLFYEVPPMYEGQEENGEKDKKIYSCSLCSYMGTYTSTLCHSETHKIEYKDLKDVDTVCPVCNHEDKYFFMLNHLSKHAVECPDLKNILTCPVCGRYVKIQRFRLHLKLHILIKSLIEGKTEDAIREMIQKNCKNPYQKYEKLDDEGNDKLNESKSQYKKCTKRDCRCASDVLQVEMTVQDNDIIVIDDD